MKTQVLIATLLASTTILVAQETTTETKGYKYNNVFDVAAASVGSQSAVAGSWVHFHGVGSKQRFKIGYGVRFSSQFGKNLTYTTAPAIITSKQQGPQVLFSKIYNENIDTVYLPKAQNNMLNLSINLQYTIKNKVDIGFNIDAVGVTFGKGITGNYHSAASTYPNSNQAAKPTSFNALLVSDNDLGSLNSELYVRYWFNEHWAVRAGASFMFTEYTTNNKLRLDNNRFRNKSLMPLIGISYTPFK